MEHFNDDMEVVMRDPILFGDFRTALQEEETRIYEDIQDYEAAKALFQVWMGLTFSTGSLCLGALLSGAQHWEEYPCLCLGVQNESWCLIRWLPRPVVRGDDLRNVLNTQTPGFTPLAFHSSSPGRVPGFQCTARFGNHSALCYPFSF